MKSLRIKVTYKREKKQAFMMNEIFSFLPPSFSSTEELISEAKTVKILLETSEGFWVKFPEPIQLSWKSGPLFPHSLYFLSTHPTPDGKEEEKREKENEGEKLKRENPYKGQEREKEKIEGKNTNYQIYHFYYAMEEIGLEKILMQDWKSLQILTCLDSFWNYNEVCCLQSAKCQSTATFSAFPCGCRGVCDPCHDFLRVQIQDLTRLCPMCDTLFWKWLRFSPTLISPSQKALQILNQEWELRRKSKRIGSHYIESHQSFVNSSCSTQTFPVYLRNKKEVGDILFYVNLPKESEAPLSPSEVLAQMGLADNRYFKCGVNAKHANLFWIQSLQVEKEWIDLILQTQNMEKRKFELM